MLKFRGSKNDGARPAATLFSKVALLALLSAGGCTRYESIGGDWYAGEQTRFPEAGIQQATLYREDSGRRSQVASQVIGWFYFGEDCLAYVTAETSRVYVACGDRRPVALDTSNIRGEIVSPKLMASGVEYRTSGGDQMPRLRFARDRILAAAMAQPLRGPSDTTDIWLIRPD